jgi:hypothetical protein
MSGTNRTTKINRVAVGRSSSCASRLRGETSIRRQRIRRQLKRAAFIMSVDKTALPDAIRSDLIALFNAGEWPRLRIAARRATDRYPVEILGWQALGKALAIEQAPGGDRRPLEAR